MGNPEYADKFAIACPSIFVLLYVPFRGGDEKDASPKQAPNHTLRILP